MVATTFPMDPGDLGKVLVVRAGTAHPEYKLEDWRPIVALSETATFGALSAAITIPSDGTWDVEVWWTLRYDTNSGINTRHEIVGDILKDAVSVKKGATTAFFGQSASGVDLTFPYYKQAETAASYTYTVDVVTNGSAVVETPADRLLHSLKATATRRL